MDGFIILEYSCVNFLNLLQISIKRQPNRKIVKNLGKVIHRKITGAH